MKKLSKEEIEQAFDEYKKKKKEIVDQDLPLTHKGIRKVTRPIQRFLLKAQRAINHQTVELMGNYPYQIPEGRNVIFVVSHIGKWDFEIVNEQIKEQFYIMASDFCNMYGNFNGFMMNWFGVFFVDEVSKEDRRYTSAIAKKALREGCNVMILSEGTWNLSPNEIIMDTHFGAVDIALSEGALILPISIEQYDKHFVINFGKIYDPSDIANEVSSIPYKNLSDKKDDERDLRYQIKSYVNADMRDRLATLKWDIWEKMPGFKRDEIPSDYWNSFIEDRLKEWPGYSMQEQIDNTVHTKPKKEHALLLEELRNIFKMDPYYFLSTDEHVVRLLNVLDHMDELEQMIAEYRANQTTPSKEVSDKPKTLRKVD